MFGMFDYQVLLTVRRLILESQRAADPEDALESALLEAAGAVVHGVLGAYRAALANKNTDEK